MRAAALAKIFHERQLGNVAVTSRSRRTGVTNFALRAGLPTAESSVRSAAAAGAQSPSARARVVARINGVQWARTGSCVT
jgi:hypothetical protein